MSYTEFSQDNFYKLQKKYDELKDKYDRQRRINKAVLITEKPKMSEAGLHYRLESLQEEILHMDEYPEAGFKEAVQKDKEIIETAFAERESYIEHLENLVLKLREGIKSPMNLYRVNNEYISRSGGYAFAVAPSREEALKEVKAKYHSEYEEAAEEGLLDDLRAELLLENIHLDKVHFTHIYYF